jgi:CubicO group peptidase (beta-lactamase class C family)
VKSPALRLLMVALVLAGRAFCQASASPSDAVSQYVKAEMARQHIPGIALLVSRNGEILRAQGFGFSNIELQVPVKPETLFQSGSVGKQFTAMAIMMLVEEGKIGLDDSITKYFPDAPASWKPVTVRHLLSHTGAFTDYPDNFNFRKDYTEDELLKIVAAIPLVVFGGDEMELQQSRILDPGHPHPPGQRQVLRPCTGRAYLSPTRDAEHAHQ